MEHVLNISASELHRLMSAPATALEQALRDAMEKIYGTDHAGAILEEAAINASIPGEEQGGVIVVSRPKPRSI